MTGVATTQYLLLGFSLASAFSIPVKNYTPLIPTQVRNRIAVKSLSVSPNNPEEEESRVF